MKWYVFLTATVCLLLSVYSAKLKITLYLVVFLACAAVFGFFIFKKSFQKGIAVCLAVIAMFSIFSINYINSINKIINADGKKVYLSAVVCGNEEQRDANKTRTCTLKILSSDNDLLKRSEKVRLYYDAEDELKLGTKIDGEFTIVANDNLSFLSVGIRCFLRIENVRFSDSKIFLYDFCETVQSYIKETLLNKTRNSALLIAMLYGERGFISPMLENYVKTCGVSHILVVSGLHFSIICGAFMKLCNLLFKRQVVKDIIFLLFIFCFAAVCGFSVSVLRVGVIYAVMIIYKKLNRLDNSLVGFCDALIVVLFINPMAFHSVSFQLSFSATLGLLVLYPYLRRAIYYRYNNRVMLSLLLKSSATTLSACVFTFPTCVYYFGWVSVVSIPVNIVIGFAVTVILICTSSGVVMAAVGVSFLEKTLFFISDAFADYFVKVIKVFSEFPFATIRFRNTETLTACVLVVYLFIFVLYTCKRYKFLIKSKLKEE